MPNTFSDDFDPDAVPPFPVLTVEVTRGDALDQDDHRQEASTEAQQPDQDAHSSGTAASDTYEVLLNGAPVPVPALPHPPSSDDDAQQHAMDTAIAAVAQHIADGGWTACHVNVVDPDGSARTLVMGPEGTIPSAEAEQIVVPVVPRLHVEVRQAPTDEVNLDPTDQRDGQNQPDSTAEDATSEDDIPRPATVYTYEVLLNGAPVSVPALPHPPSSDDDAQQHAMDTAIAAAARHIAQRRWTACRVNAVDPDGMTWPMIVGPNGERENQGRNEDDQRDGSERPQPRRRWWPAVATAIVSAVIVGIAGAFALNHNIFARSSEPTISQKPAAIPTEFPVLPPVGSTTHARWSFGPLISAQTRVAVLPDGRIATLSGDQLVVLDQENGRVVWAADLGPEAEGPWLSDVDGIPALVVTTSEAIEWWAATDLAQHRSVTRPESSTVTVTATGVLTILPDQHALVLLSNGNTSERVIPAGAEALTVTGRTIWATNHRQLWKLDAPRAHTPPPMDLAAPMKGATSSQPFAWKAGSLAVAWQAPGGKKTIVTLYDQHGRIHANKTLDESVTPAIDDLGHPRYTILAERYVIDHRDGTVTGLPDNWTGTVAIIDDDLFGQITPTPARYSITNRKVTTTPESQAATPLGHNGPDTLAIAPYANGHVLYSLQRD